MLRAHGWGRRARYVGPSPASSSPPALRSGALLSAPPTRSLPSLATAPPPLVATAARRPRLAEVPRGRGRDPRRRLPDRRQGEQPDPTRGARRDDLHRGRERELRLRRRRRPATVSAKLDKPEAVAPLLDGGFLIADTPTAASGGWTHWREISTVAGNGNCNLQRRRRPATLAELCDPSAVVPTPDGGFLIADTATESSAGFAGRHYLHRRRDRSAGLRRRRRPGHERRVSASRTTSPLPPTAAS